MLLEVLGDRRVPVVEVAELGHVTDVLTFPVGVRATLDTAAGVLALDEPAVV